MKPARNVATALWLSSPRFNLSLPPGPPLPCPATQPVPRLVVQPALRSWRPSPPAPREIAPPPLRHPSSRPRHGFPLFSTPIGPYCTPPPPTMPTLARDSDDSFAPTKPPGGHTGTISTTARCGASVPLRRGETSVQSQRKKSPLEEKRLSFSPSRYILSYHRPHPSVSLFLRPPPRDSFSSTSVPVPSRVPRPSPVSLLSFLLLLSRIFFFRAFCHSVSVRPVAGANNATWSRCKNKGRVTEEKGTRGVGNWWWCVRRD